MINRRFVLTSRPTGLVSSANFRFEEVPLPMIKDGELLVRVKYVSLDPTHRIWMSDMEQYMEPIALGDTVRAFGVGVVEESKAQDFKKGDLVSGLLNWQDYAVGNVGTFQKLPPLDVSPTAFLSVLGLTGVTAYFGYLDITSPKAGETLVVSGAAGAVGSIVGQIGKIKGQKVIGIAGSDDKCRWLTNELGFDGAINYRKDDVSAKLKSLCPSGVDIYFDNVGGAISEAVWARMNLFGRISVCGLISGYNEGKQMLGPKNFSLILMKRLKVQGFIVIDYAQRWAEAVHALYGWVKEGKIKYSEDIEEGLENAPQVLNKLFDGSNTGKLILKVS
ncbi:MAG: NADP-dependent oxidoreductase [Deltaproteobacteria bacterium]|nr:NADP-dependent oxidoreductase [Deltaproteobacteria bacterium]